MNSVCYLFSSAYMVLLLLIPSDTSYAQQETKDALIFGEWKSFKREIYNGQPTDSVHKNVSSGNLIFDIVLSKDGSGYDNILEGSFSYSLSGDTLNLGNRVYTIEELEEASLVIREVPKPTSLVTYRYYFIKP